VPLRVEAYVAVFLAPFCGEPGREDLAALLQVVGGLPALELPPDALKDFPRVLEEPPYVLSDQVL
jgi:hypothetical protein